jgi:hypothetical protein
MSASTEHRKLAAIMFTDMVSYSALMESDEALALHLLEEHRGLLRSIFPKHPRVGNQDDGRWFSGRIFQCLGGRAMRR